MRVVGGQEVHTEVVRLIEEAQRTVVLISPYLDPWTRLERAIEDASDRGVQVVLVVRGGRDLEKQTEKMGPLLRFRGVTGLCLERLHAKLYLSESSSIITSMNLLGTSALDSHEAAVVFDKGTDQEGYSGLSNLARDILSRAERDTKRAAKKKKQAAAKSVATALLSAFTSAPTKPATTKKKTGSSGTSTKKSSVRFASAAGHCIRCRSALPLNVKKPLCPKCYTVWAKYKDTKYVEKHCHGCGKTHAASVAKPCCRSCYRKVAV